MPILDFKGKSVIYSHHLRVPFRSLNVDKKKSFSSSKKSGKKPNPSLDDNLIIHGDNLHALKALVPKYNGRIKCIYIDPPYNTGNEGWKYNDKVNSPIMKEWLKQNGIGTDDLERHDKWLCMMWPRLQLLKELLSDDGVIFVSIDDNECYNLKTICDEVFNNNNFIGIFTINSAPNGRDYGHIGKNHEFCLFYAKDIENCKTNLLPDIFKKFNYKDNRGNFNIHPLYNSNEVFNNKNRPNLYYPFYLHTNKPIRSLGKNFYEIGLEKRNDSIKIYPPLSQKNKVQLVWRWEKKKSLKQMNQDIIGYKTSNNDYRIVQKMRTDKKLIRSIISGTEYTSRKGTAEVEEILTGKQFLFPKPVHLIRQFVKVASNKNSIILDSFAGSGTTAHAVLDLNKEDGGSRKFILVECEDYVDSVTAERVRRVIKGVPKAKDEKLKRGLGGSFTYCNLGEEISAVNLLKGKNLPDYKQLAEYVFYTATGESLSKVFKANPAWFIGESSAYRFHLIYKPDLDFLRSKESALHEDLAETIKKFNRQSKKTSLVFAPAKYITQKELLKDYGIQFCQLPYDIHKIMGA